MYTLYRLLDDYFMIRLNDNKIILSYQISYNINRVLTGIEYAIRRHLYKIPNQFQKYFIHMTLNCLNLKSNIRFDFVRKEVVITTKQKNVKVLEEFLTTYKYKFLITYSFKSSMLTMIFPLFIENQINAETILWYVLLMTHPINQF
jgi:glycerol-3-phosphate responsive antiterminator